jgi:hypothetical protein
MDDSMPGEPAPPFEASDLTTDQHGMLEILGNPPVLDYRHLQFQLEAPQISGVPSIAPTYIVEHRCPVVRVLGRERLILPNGDVMELTDEFPPR